MNELPKMYDKVNKLQLCSINNYHLDSNTSCIIEKKNDDSYDDTKKRLFFEYMKILIFRVREDNNKGQRVLPRKKVF